MKKIALLVAFVGITLSASAQQLKEGYIKWPSSSDLHDYVNQFTNNNKVSTVGGVAWEDEAFFISRVRPRAPFRNSATQVISTFNENNDKRLCYWVPVGNCADGQVHTNALPNGTMDGEVFSMWSYVSHYGDWTSPYGWVPGSFADVAHKNGVAVSGVASIPWGSLSSNSTWQSEFISMGNMNGTNVAKFMYYHGCDGLGYNSEFSTSSSYVANIRTVHNAIRDYMADKNPLFENVWYAGTNDSGSISFDSGIGSFTGLFASSSMFQNYNYSGTLSGIVSTANSMGKSPLFVYAGNNMQGGEPRSGQNWKPLSQYNVSIGLWGAHNYNMFWQSRNSNGSTPAAMQRTYINLCEQWFTNGPKNPAIRIAPFNQTQHNPNDRFCGMSSMMTARSAIQGTIATDPFITYFNLGNGSFFNWMGERVSDNEWYNIGLQDYLPTWRYWFAPSFLNGNVQASQVSLKAEFNWDEAFFGGSSFRIYGTSANEYLHLFKTDLTVANGQVITVRYKLLGGEANIALVASSGTNTSEISLGNILTLTQCADKFAASHAEGAEGWQTATINLNNATVRKLNSGNIACLALKITNANDMNLYLGELSIKTNSNTTTPTAPINVTTKVLANNMHGVDGKLFWKMTGEKALPEPTYNDDVKTSIFKMYAQEEGGKPMFVGATTSWAGIAFQAPNTDASKKIRFGVSAVSRDFNSESAITWGTYLSKGTYELSNAFELNKNVIKPNESFTIGYVDPEHSASNWKLYNRNGQVVAEATGKSITVEAGLPNVGGYDLVVDNNERYNYYVQISPNAIGAVPAIETLTIKGKEVTSNAPVTVALNDNLTVGYTAQPANGKASRGIRLGENLIGVQNSQLKFGASPSFSFGLWIKFDEFPTDQWDFFNVWDRSGAWPKSNWGWAWSYGNSNGQLEKIVFRGSDSNSTPPGELHYNWTNTQFKPGIWTHIMVVSEYGTQGFRCRLYVNGQKQQCQWVQQRNPTKTTGNEDDWVPGHSWSMSNKDVLCLGGPKYQGKAVDGIVDEFQVWNRALTDEEVLQAMNGYPAGTTIPSGLIGYWDFESDTEPMATGEMQGTTAITTPYAFRSRGTNTEMSTYNYRYQGGENEGQGFIAPMSPLYSAGSVFVTGEKYVVNTVPTWKDRDFFTQIEGTGNDVAGSANVRLREPATGTADHELTLTLENSYGKDVKTYPVFKITSGVDAIAADAADLKAYTVGDMLFVEFAEDGNYQVDVYNVAGVALVSEPAHAVAGQTMTISLNQKGIYVINVSKDGKRVRSLKVVSK